MTQAANLATVGSNANSGGTLITSGTAVTLTTQTSVVFSSIPSWVKRITIMYTNVITSGASVPIIQLGTSGGLVTTGYSSTWAQGGYSTSAYGFTTTGLSIGTGVASVTSRVGMCTIVLVSGNNWVMNGVGTFVYSGFGYSSTAAGNITLASPLTQISLTTVNGTDQYTSGSVNILYE
jgi:hypothetical protein